MSISPTTSMSKPTGSEKISIGTFGYINARNRQHAYDLVIRQFKKSGLTQAALASRLGKGADVVSRLLSRPRNWELDTFSELLFAISGAVAKYDVVFPLGKPEEPTAAQPEETTAPGRLVFTLKKTSTADDEAIIRCRRDGAFEPVEPIAA